MPKAKRAKSRKPRKDKRQLELTEQPLRVSAGSSTADEVDESDLEEEFEDQELPRKKFIHRVWNCLIGLSLLPFAWIFTRALFRTFSNAVPKENEAPFWMSHSFLMFALGGVIWLAWMGLSFWIWKRPRPVRAYVLGHELMHVLMARVFRGRIKDYHISAEGGYIVTNKYNFLIALAPYLWPFYAVPVLAVWSLSFYWKDVPYMREVFLAALGFTWMFHLTFTLWVLPNGQSDFHGPGRTFSFALIYLANTILLSGTLVILAPEVTWSAYGAELRESTLAFYRGAARVVEQVYQLVSAALASRSQA